MALARLTRFVWRGGDRVRAAPVWRATALSGAALLAQTQAGRAQTLEQLQQLSIAQLSQIEVTSVAKQKEPLSDAPAAIYVITHQDIIRSGATTVPEMLRLAPNLNVAQLSSTTYEMSARGFNASNNAIFSNKLLVLIDGRSVYTPLFGGMYWDMQAVPPEDVDRIEVISGPGATLWGANAVNGVINIITRNSNDTQGGLLTVGAGNYELYDAVQYGGRLGPNLTYRVHGDFTHFNAFPQAGGGNAGDAWYRPQGGFRVDWDPPGQSLSLQGDIFNATEQPANTIRGGDAMVTWRRDLSDNSHLQVLAYYDNAQRWTDNNGGFAVETYDLEVQHSFRFAGWNDVVWGAGERVINYDIQTPGGPGGLRFQPGGATLSLANIFAQDTISLASTLKLTLGLKLEDEPYAGVQPLPSVRLAWNATDHVLLWAAISRAVRSPTPVDTTIQEWVGGRDILNGSTNFIPEKLTAYEVGTRVQLSPHASFSVSGFYNVYNDLRSINVAGPGSSSALVFGNQIAATSFGVEAWANYQLTDWWQVSAGISAEHENFRYLPGSLSAVGLAWVADDPGHQASLRSTMNLGHGVTLEAFLREVGELPHPVVPGYTELNARIGWQVNRRLNLSLSGFNLLHPQHVEFINPGQSTEIPRMVFAQAQVRF